MLNLKEKKLNKIICFLLAFICVFVIVPFDIYADDSLPELPSEDPVDQASEGLSDSDLMEASEQILAILQTNDSTSTKATEYTTTDIYNLLFRILSGGNSSQYANLRTIQNLIQTIANAMTDNNTSAPPTTGNTVYALLWDIHAVLYSMESQFHLNQLSDLTSYLNYSMYDYLILLCEATSEINNYLPNLIPTDYTYLFNSIISGINNIYNKVNSIYSVNLDLSSFTNSINNTLKNYSWSSYINNTAPYLVGYTSDFETLLNTGTTQSTPFYAWFAGMPTDQYNSYIVSIELPLTSPLAGRYVSVPDPTLYIRYNNNLYSIKNTDYIIVPNKSSFTIYAILPMFSLSDEFVVGFPDLTYSDRLYIGSVDPIIKFLKDDTKDYWAFYDRIINKNMTNNIDKLTQLYASDDLLAAKAEQQEYEDQAIEDFTGSGSAAASTSDLGSLKGISGSISSGLNSGGSITDATSVLSTSSELWGWFTQGTKDSLDNTSQFNNRKSSSDEEIINIYELNNSGLLDWFH